MRSRQYTSTVEIASESLAVSKAGSRASLSIRGYSKDPRLCKSVLDSKRHDEPWPFHCEDGSTHL
jgi:hypothetical protein